MVPMVTVNTKDILFICGGAFPDLDEIIRQRLTKETSIGFNAEIKNKTETEIGVLFKQVQPEDLTKFGLIPEFVGRVPINVSLDPLDEEALVRVLTEPKNAIIKQYKTLFELDGVKLEFEDDAIWAIAHQAYSRKTGARGLRSILEHLMNDLMFTIPSDDSIEECVITKEAVEGSSAPLIVHRETPLKKAE
ncbi:MAG: AAA family ATPase, partial [Lachnospiraceae bacterium]|nr:AAA family ATPase [Lachnospiraceae bacterium]